MRDIKKEYRDRKEIINKKGLKKRQHHNESRSYKRGDSNKENTHRFDKYNMTHEGIPGYFYEQWVPNGEFQAFLTKQSKGNRERRYQTKKTIEKLNPPKRINPSTGEPFKRGDIRKDGKIFLYYLNHGALVQNKYRPEKWATDIPKTYKTFRFRVGTLLSKAKKRSVDKKLPFDLDIDYLVSVFPEDMICPVFKTKMSFGGELKTSPSIDRNIPEKGYVKGNISIISYRANQLKRDSNFNEMKLLFEWMKKEK